MGIGIGRDVVHPSGGADHDNTRLGLRQLRHIAAGRSRCLLGIKPAVVAIILGALWRLGRKGSRIGNWLIGAGVTLAALLGTGVVGVTVGGVVGMAWLLLQTKYGKTLPIFFAAECDRRASHS